MSKVHVGKFSVNEKSSPNGSDADVSDSGEDDEMEETTSKAGLADAMAKILGKKVPTHTQVILAKSKTDKEIAQKRIEVKEENGIENEETTNIKSHQHFIAAMEKKKLWEELGRVKPDPLERDREKSLQRIAQRGVVQLFNAVRRQQKIIEDKMSEVGPSERKQAKVMETVTKSKFLDILKGRDSNEKRNKAKSTSVIPKVEPIEIKEENEEEEDSSKWNALREDFMLGAKMKDWDKQSDGDDEDNDLNDNDDIDDSESDAG